jgi:hypothetical protein
MTETTGAAQRRRWTLFRGPDDAGAIYGTLAAMAVIAGAAGSKAHGPVLALTIATLAVFWLAHVYAAALAHHLQAARRLHWPIIRAAMVEESSLLKGPVPMLVLLAIARVGLIDELLARRLALWAGVAQLVGWGVAYAHHQRWGWPTAVVAGLVNGAFGLIIVVLEVLIH